MGMHTRSSLKRQLLNRDEYTNIRHTVKVELFFLKYKRLSGISVYEVMQGNKYVFCVQANFYSVEWKQKSQQGLHYIHIILHLS